MDGVYTEPSRAELRRTRVDLAKTVQRFPIDEVERNAKGHFFDRGVMRYFRTRLPETGYRGPGGRYFVTSEQFVSGFGEKAPRRYTVRLFNDGRQVETVGPFNRLTRTKATQLARDLAAGILDRKDIEEELE